MFWVNIVRGSEQRTHTWLFFRRDQSEGKLTPHSGHRALPATPSAGAAATRAVARLPALLIPAATAALEENSHYV